MQEGFIKIFRHLDKYNHEGSFEGWVRKIMVRRAITYLRDNKRHNGHVAIEGIRAYPQLNILDKLAEKEIAAMLSKLPPIIKKIFLLHAVEGYNHREIAAILGCNESSSKSQYYRSRERMQELLKQSA